MFSIQVFLMLLTGVLWPQVCAVDASAILDGPVVVKTDCCDEAEEARVKLVASVEDDDEGEGKAKKCIVVGKVNVDGEDDQHPIHKAKTITINLGEDEDNAGGPAKCKRLVVKREGEQNIEAGGPWLGIQFGPVPKPLAAHLELNADVGQMVSNVVEGSPADDAGLAQYDVIVKVDGEDVSSDIGAFLDKVRALEPGETYTFALIHDGKQTQADLTVGERPEDAASAKHKYKEAVEEFLKQREFHRGGLLEKDDEGTWLFKRFDLEDMPDVFEFFPKGRSYNFDFDFSDAFPHSERNEFIWKTDDGTELRIECDEDGEITVKRTVTQGDVSTTTVKTYANEEELEKEDPEAYEVLHKTSGGKLSILRGDGGKMSILLAPGKKLGIPKFSPEDFKVDIDIDEILEATKEVRENAKELREKLQKEYGAKGLGLAKGSLIHKRPRTSFEILSDGEIRVTQRQGDEELVETFKSAEALKAKRPELHKKFERLHGVESKKKSKPSS